MLTLNEEIMKKLLTVCALSIASFAISQENLPTFKAEGDLVKATYYYEDGSIKTIGFFKDKKLTGKWTKFDKSGNKTQLAFYEDGKKVGKWFIWSEDSLKEITYAKNTIKTVSTWKPESRVAVNEK